MGSESLVDTRYSNERKWGERKRSLFSCQPRKQNGLYSDDGIGVPGLGGWTPLSVKIRVTLHFKKKEKVYQKVLAVSLVRGNISATHSRTLNGVNVRKVSAALRAWRNRLRGVGQKWLREGDWQATTGEKKNAS